MSIDWFIHAANVLYLISYLVKEIFILRFITVIATLTLVPFYLFQGNDPLWAPIIWAGIFTVVNTYQIILLFKERRPVFLTEAQQEIYDLSFNAFTVKQFAKILKSSKTKEFNKGQVLFEKGDDVKQIMFITKGEAAITKNQDVRRMSAGDLVADVNLITDSPIKYTISCAENCSLISWDKADFEKILKSDTELNSSWQSLISSILAKKLVSAK